MDIKDRDKSEWRGRRGVEERGRERERERVCVYVCVCVRERERNGSERVNLRYVKENVEKSSCLCVTYLLLRSSHVLPNCPTLSASRHYYYLSIVS